MKLKARMVFEWDYDFKPEAYGTDNPLEGAKMDLKNDWHEFLEIFLDTIEPKEWTIVPILSGEFFRK